MTNSPDYTAVRAYVVALYTRFRVERLLLDIGAKNTTQQLSTAINPIFMNAIDGLSVGDVVDAILLNTPPIFLMMLEDAIENGEIGIQMPAFSLHKYNGKRFVPVDGVVDDD